MKKYLFFILFAVIAIGALFFLRMPSDDTTQKSIGAENNSSQIQPQEQKEVQMTITITKEGVGNTQAKKGDTVRVHYTGWLMNDTKFDSSRDRSEPFEFILGAGQVIQGWDAGVVGMRVGEVRRFVIPPELAYGSQGIGNVIPPNSTLIFEVEMVSIKEVGLP